MSKQRSQSKAKAETALTSDEHTFTTPVPEGTDPDTLPFAEFSEQDLNLEKWDGSVLAKDKTTSSQQKIIFEDPHEVHLPDGIAVHQWKRCSDIYPNVSFVVFINSSEYPDLITPNRHLLNSSFYRDFMSSIETLLYIGCTKPFPQDYEHASFSTGGVRPWRPWHHIYSNCKITKGEHSPMYNPAGKYVVRLFWLGTWRKIYVDDLMPLDKSNNILLPSLHLPQLTTQHLSEEVIAVGKPTKTKTKGSAPVKKDTIELWPMILCKALLKIASLSSFRILNTSNEFDIINCLTGWVPQKIKTKDISAVDLWDIFMAYVQRFEWPEEKDGSTKKSGSTKTKSKGKEGPDTPKKGTKGVIPSGIENMRDGDRFMTLSCSSFESTEVSENPEDQSKIVFLSEVRDIPIIQPPPRPELESWKRFRYEKWAVDHGIISPDVKKLNIQSLKIIDPFKKLLPSIDSQTHHEDLISFLAVDNTDKKSEKSSKSSKRPTTSGKGAILQPDPSEWIDFNDIRSKIGYLTIYFQPRTFKTKIKVSDIHFTNKTASFHHVISPYVLKETRNEPIYMFMDSIDYKLVLINLSQMGDTSMLVKTIEEEEVEIIHTSEDLDLCDEIVLRKTIRNKDKSKSSLEVDESSVYNLKGQPISLVLEEYSWESNSLGRCRGLINTIGTKSLLIDLKPGRVSFRIWLSSHCSYVLQIFSDTPAVVGCLEEYLIACSEESQLLTNLCYELSSCYGKLVQSFGLPDYTVSLRNFYHCYKPYQHLTKQELATVHKIFFEEFCKIISENTVHASLNSVKLLFMQLKTFDYINPYLEEPHLYPTKFELEDQIQYAKIMQRAAVKIQAFFKRIYIKSLLRKMNDSHKQYYEIFETLKRVYIEIFSSDNRLVYCPILLRKFFERGEMTTLNDKFELCQDIQSVLAINVYTGTLAPRELSWILICRYEFYINSDEPVLVKVNLFCNLKTYSVRVFDNDTMKETPQVINNVVVDKYYKNTNGYSVVCYGWCDNLHKVDWKLILATRKMSRDDIILISNYSLSSLTFKDQYVPNCDDIICRYNIDVGSTLFLTANLSTSFEQARFSLKLMDESGNVLREACGTKSVVFPVVLLQCAEASLDTRMRANEDIQGAAAQKKRVTTVSGASNLTLGAKKNLSNTSALKSITPQKRSITDERDTSHKHHKKASFPDISDGDDEMSFGSLRSDQDSERKHQPKKGNIKTGLIGSRISLPGRSRSRIAVMSNVTNNKIIEYTHPAHTEYILEAKVIGDSWPLTANEWQRVQKAREKSYLNLLDERRASTKRYPSAKKIAMPMIDEPYWILDLAFSSENILDCVQDVSPSERRKQMKNEWFKDIERYKRGIKLREAYLEENTISKSETQADENKRSNDSKDFAVNIVGGESLEKYMIKPLEEVDEDSCKTKSDDDYIIEEASIDHDVKAYQADENAMAEEFESLLEEQKENFEILTKWFEDIRNESLEMSNEAKALENEYIKTFLHSSTKSKGDKKEKKK